MLSYLAAGRELHRAAAATGPGSTRPYRSPLGIAGAVVTLVLAALTLAFQLLDPVFVTGVLWRRRVVRARHHLVRAGRPTPARAGARGSLRDQANDQRATDAPAAASRSRSAERTRHLLAEALEVGRRAAARRLSLRMVDRIDRLAVAQQLEMQMRAGRAAGAADEADELAAQHRRRPARCPAQRPRDGRRPWRACRRARCGSSCRSGRWARRRPPRRRPRHRPACRPAPRDRRPRA